MRTKLLSLVTGMLLILNYTYAQRPENVYIQKSFTNVKNVNVERANLNSTSFAVDPTSFSRNCDCYRVDFGIVSDSLITINDSAYVWNHTFEYNVSTGNYKGFWNFEDDCMNFMHYADTTWSSMAYWDGFTISRTTKFPCDTSCSDNCSGLRNQFSATPKGGKHGASDGYAVAYYGYNADYFPEKHCVITLDEPDTICGLYLTTNAYTYKSIKCGDSFASAFEYGDYYYVTIKGYYNGTFTDSVVYYLADYRSSTAYIVDEWKHVNLTSLNKVDSVSFEITTSDVGEYGPNTPMYFCMDAIQVGMSGCRSCPATDNTHDTFPTPGYPSSKKIKEKAQSLKLLVSPNLTIETEPGSDIFIFNRSGKSIEALKTKSGFKEVHVGDLKSGLYIIKVTKNGKVASTNFIKK